MGSFQVGRYHQPVFRDFRGRISDRPVGLTRGSPSMRIESWFSAEDKSRYKVVRRDNFTDVPGDIVTADEASGECCMYEAGDTKTLSFGSQGISIVWQNRR